MEEKLKRWIPPGASLSAELKGYAAMLVLTVLISFTFLVRYFDQLGRLYEYRYKKKILIEGAMMPALSKLLDHCFLGVVCMILFACLIAVYHYYSFYQESKSIYVMKRLASRIELWRRCLTLPVLAVLAACCLAGILMGLYAGIYFFVTPNACIPPVVW